MRFFSWTSSGEQRSYDAAMIERGRSMKARGQATMTAVRAVALAIAAAVLAAGLVVAASPAGAAGVITVTTTADVIDAGDGLVSLREAMALSDAQPGDDTIVLATGATYALTLCSSSNGVLSTVAPSLLTIQGHGSTVDQTCGSGPQRANAFQTSAFASLALHDLTVTHAGTGIAAIGDPTQGVLLDHVTVQDTWGDCVDVGGFRHLTLQASHLTGCGGQAIGMQPALTMEGSEISGSVAVTNYQQIGVVTASSATIIGSSVHDNPGGGVYVIGEATVTDSHVDRNGGRLSAFHAGHLSATRSTFDDNTSTDQQPPSPMQGVDYSRGPAGVWVSTGATLDHVSVARNTGRVAGVYAPPDASSPMHLSLTDSHVDGNSAQAAAQDRQMAGVVAAAVTDADFGAGSGEVTVTRTTANANHASDDAGIASTLPLTVTDSTVAGNVVLDGGTHQGTASVAAFSSLMMSGTTVSDNTVRAALPGAAFSAGGVLAQAYGATFTNDTITGNHGDVGGAFAVNGGTFSHVTLADNTGGARHLSTMGGVSLSATTLSSPAGSLGASCGNPPGVQHYRSLGYVFVSDSTCDMLGGTGDLIGAGDPLLRPLAQAGGPTATRVPVAASPLRDRIPAADADNCSGADQRGVARPQAGMCDIGAVELAGASYHPLPPSRILDSRVAGGPGFVGKVVAGTPRLVRVAGPPTGAAAGAQAVVLNVTVTESSAGSYLSLWPQGTSEPSASVLNFGPGQTISNLATVTPGPDGQVLVATNAGATDVVIDLLGYYGDDAGGVRWAGTAPTRAVDSRTSVGGWNGPLAAGSPRALSVRGAGGVPSTATAVVANVTVTNSSANSFLTVWPGGAIPASSNVQFAAGQTIANLVVMPMGADGAIRFATAVGHTDVVVDVTGFFDPAAPSVFHPIAPVRVLDDRVGLGLSGPWTAGQVRAFPLGDAVASGATGVVANVTVTNPSAGSFLTVFEHGTEVPTASSLNFGPAQTIANATIPRLAAGQIDVKNHAGTVDVIADLAGWFGPAT
jgi:hypothetical protein